MIAQIPCVHDYEPVKEDHKAIVEVCNRCKKKLITRKNNKKDDLNYLKEHKRDVLQPDNPLFKKEYGDKAQRRADDLIKYGAKGMK